MLRRSERIKKTKASNTTTTLRRKPQIRSRQSMYHPRRREDTFLCEPCATIFSEISVRGLFRAPEQGIVIRDSISSTKTETCSMCHFIERNLESYGTPNGEAAEIRLFSSRKSFFWLYQKYKKDVETVPLLAVVPKGLFAQKETPKDLIRTCISEFLMPAYSDPSSTSISSNKVLEQELNLEFINKCVSYCEDHHACRRLQNSYKGSILLYDYKRQKKILRSLPCKYIALSYVCGEDSPITDSSPQVIADVVKVAEMLKIDYIWVDTLCINPERLQEQLNSMHFIYKNAYLTVVDGAGHNIHHGLYGVSRPRTGKQTRIRVNSQLWLSTLNNPQLLIECSTWMTRRWTYQEAVGSARLLIFTEEQVYFECKGMRSWESLHIPLDSHHRKDRKACPDSLQEPIFCQITKQPEEYFDLEDFPRYIKEYTKRFMTEDHYALNAIKGVLVCLESKRNYVYSFWGLPLLSAGEASEFPVALLTGMAWTLGPRNINESPIPITRNNLFPSWTWAGWHGAVTSFGLTSLNHYANRTSIRIQEKKGSEDSLSWQEFWNKLGGMQMNRQMTWSAGFGSSTQTQPYDYPWIDLETGVFEVKLAYFDEPRLVEVIDCIALSGFKIMPPDERSFPTHIDFPEDDLELHHHNKIEVCQQFWKCVMLGYQPEIGSRREKTFPMVILLKPRKECEGYERVWGGRLAWFDGWDKVVEITNERVRLY
ncbi:HET-domain-containing protein [Aspergillus violaceofuscus CBS 115571]|uniref:HET-domain-containing protein n=1 Tax=Aspergillus violaceofuscus (strain CBS 115571) TaxID=1450538 RepID=A0A2V5H417_ASPV1|nr:HET-domain-containing protein [Aspergillus violaceofuscus CBS 115571]